MNDTMRTLLKMGIPGFVIGAIIGYMLTFIFSMMNGEGFLVAPELVREIGEVPAYIVQIVLSGTVGFVGTVGTFVYYSERIGLTLASLSHCLMCLAVFIPTAHVLWWTDRTLEGALLFTGMIVCMYALMWFAVFVSNKVQIDDINRKIEDRRSKRQ
jgi:hypothetical protein